MATRLGVDLDGVVYDWQRTYRYMIREYRGVFMPPVHDFWFYWDAQKEYGTPEDHKWMWSEGVKLGLFRYGHMIRGARRGLERLHADGYKIEVITHRPETAVNDTLDWLSLFFKDIPIAGVHILSNGESKTSVPADILVDDKPENVQEWVDDGRRAIQFLQPWNWDHNIEGAEEAGDWEQVVELLTRDRS